MNSRTLLAASVSAFASIGLVAPSVHAQVDDGIGSGGSSDVVGSVGSGSVGSEGGSLVVEDANDDGAICELPGLGGSVAKFYPLSGGDEVPSGVMDFVTTTLDSFPNLLDVVVGAGNGGALLGQAGSLAEGLCTSIFGGEMVLPPVTVIVDEDGVPTTTITGTTVPGASAATSTVSVTTGDAAGAGASGSVREGGVSSLPTAVPAPDIDDGDATAGN